MIGFVFFLLVMFAAIMSMASLVGACTSLLQDGMDWNRRRALICVIVAVTVAGTTVTLGYGALSFVQPMGGLDDSRFHHELGDDAYSRFSDLRFCRAYYRTRFHCRRGAPLGRVLRGVGLNSHDQYIAPVLLIVVLVTSALKSFGVVSF